MKKNENRLG